FGPVLAYFVYQRATETTYPLHGASVARYLRAHPFAPDPVSRAACTKNACKIWFHANSASGFHGAPGELSMDAYVTSFWAANGGAIGVGRWTFRLQTRTGVLSAACTTTQAQHLNDGPRFTTAMLNRWCPSFWTPAGA